MAGCLTPGRVLTAMNECLRDVGTGDTMVGTTAAVPCFACDRHWLSEPRKLVSHSSDAVLGKSLLTLVAINNQGLGYCMLPLTLGQCLVLPRLHTPCHTHCLARWDLQLPLPHADLLQVFLPPCQGANAAVGYYSHCAEIWREVLTPVHSPGLGYKDGAVVCWLCSSWCL